MFCIKVVSSVCVCQQRMLHVSIKYLSYDIFKQHSIKKLPVESHMKNTPIAQHLRIQQEGFHKYPTDGATSTCCQSSLVEEVAIQTFAWLLLCIDYSMAECLPQKCTGQIVFAQTGLPGSLGNGYCVVSECTFLKYSVTVD